MAFKLALENGLDVAIQSIGVKLRPSLETLWNSLKEHKDLLKSSVASEEDILASLRAQCNVLFTLEAAFDTFDEKIDGRNLSICLVGLASPISFPLIEILRRNYITSQAHDSPTETRRIQVRRSHEQKCVEACARTLTKFLTLIQKGQNESTDTENMPPANTQAASWLHTSFVIECVVSCSLPLPLETLDSVEKEKALYQGDDAAIALLQCIDVLLSTKHSGATQRELGKAISEAGDGGPFARIVYFCISAIASETGATTQGSRNRNDELHANALMTLRTMVMNVEALDKWRDMFPGCFAGLCQFLLSGLRQTSLSTKSSVEALKTLSSIISVALKPIEGKSENGDINSILSETRHLDVSRSSESESATSARNATNLSFTRPRVDTATKRESSFSENVNSRVPAPLVLLMNVVAVAKSPLLRVEAARFYKAILTETEGMWTPKIGKEIVLKAVECSLVLIHDVDERVASSAWLTLRAYWSHLGQKEWSKLLNTAFVPRIVSSIEELPALSRSGREMELQAKLRLLSGYLSLVTDLETGSTQSKDRSTAGSLEKWLAEENVTLSIRSSFAELFDVDFHFVDSSPTITSAAAKTTVKGNAVGIARSLLPFRYGFMSDETAVQADSFVRQFGKCLGYKSAALFVDACVADLLDDLGISRNVNDRSHVSWLHKWVGTIYVATEVLHGAYRDFGSGQKPDDRSERRGRRILKKLATSILPLITSSPVWNLPTVLNINFTAVTKLLSAQSERRQTDVGHGGFDDRGTESQSGIQWSASGLRGNASLLCVLIRLVETTCLVLKQDAEVFFPVILFPLFQRASPSNHSLVQKFAVKAINDVAKVCGLVDKHHAVQRNCDYLFGSMLSQLRSSRDSSVSQVRTLLELSGIVEFVLRIALESDGQPEGGNGVINDSEISSLQTRTYVAYVMELASTLTRVYDGNVHLLHRDSNFHAMICFSLSRVYHASISFLAANYMAQRLLQDSESPSGPPSSDTRLAVLDPFVTGKHPFCDEYDTLSPEEGFAKFRAEKKLKESASENYVSGDEIDFLNLVLTRSCFFLSNESLKVQVESCKTATLTFQILGSFAKLETAGNDNPSETAILRSISDAWPTIISHANVFRHTVSDSLSALVTRQSLTSREQDQSQHVFFSALLDLMSVLFDVSGDFLVGRFKDDVWPLVSDLLSRYTNATSLVDKETVNTKGRSSIARRRPASGCGANQAMDPSALKERQTTLVSCLKLLSSVYQGGCARSLWEIIPLAGTMIFPLLDADDYVRPVAMEAIKSMLAVDSDALCRILLTTSCEGLPQNKLRSQSPAPRAPSSKVTMQMRGALELMEYVDAIPEQPFL